MTKALQEAIKERIKDASDLVVYGISNDRDRDQYFKGLVRGLEDVLEAQLEVKEEAIKND